MEAHTGPVPSTMESVTLWTSASYLEKESTSKAKSEMRYYFESQTFFIGTALDIPEYLQKRFEAAQEARTPFIIIIQIEGNPVWLPSSMAAAFPTLQSNWTKDCLNTRLWERGTVVLPDIKKETKLMSFFMQYPTLRAKPDCTTRNAPEVDSIIKFCPVATCLALSPITATNGTQSIPLIAMSCRDREIVKVLQDHCVSGNWTLDQLSACPARIFVDLFIMLAQWSDVWRCARQELSLRDAQLHGEVRGSSVLQQTRALHRDTANVIAMQEELRLHISAFEKFKTLLHTQETRGGVGLCGRSSDKMELEQGVDDCLKNTQHYQESSAVINRQLENLLSLAFNTEMVSQGQAVARLNTLALGFLPLSWVATLFGMTNFSISSVWYPLWAVVVIGVVILAFYLPKLVPKSRKPPVPKVHSSCELGRGTVATYNLRQSGPKAKQLSRLTNALRRIHIPATKMEPSPSKVALATPYEAVKRPLSRPSPLGTSEESSPSPPTSKPSPSRPLRKPSRKSKGRSRYNQYYSGRRAKPGDFRAGGPDPEAVRKTPAGREGDDDVEPDKVASPTDMGWLSVGSN